MDNQNMNQQNGQMQNQQYQQNGQIPDPQYQQPYQQQYQQPYQQPYNPYPPRQPRNPNDGRGFSITALVLGCCGVVFCWVGILNIIILACGILGIIFGVKGRQKSIMAYGRPSGLATAGFILGIIGTSICALGVLSYLSCVACYSCAACEVANTIDSMFDL